MRRARHQTSQGTMPEQAVQHSPEQTVQHPPDQTVQDPPLTQHLPLTLHNTPQQTQQSAAHQTPEANTTLNEFSTSTNDVWKVGSMHSDGRLQVEVISGKLEPSGKCSRTTSGIMYERLEPKGFAWKDVSKDTKLFYFEEFKKWCVWRQPENLVYNAWLKSASFRYADLRCRAREHWESNGRMDNRIGKEVWLSWIEEWKTPEAKAKCEIKRRNRRGGVDDGDYPPTHTAGSASHRTVASRLDDPNPSKLFLYAHTKKHDNKTFVNKKSAEIFENLKTLRAECSKPADDSLVPQPIDEIKIYYEAVGGRNKRNRIFGIGSSQDIFYEPSNAISNYNSSQPNTQDYQKLEAELKEMKEKIKEMDEVKQRLREMESRWQTMFNSQN